MRWPNGSKTRPRISYGFGPRDTRGLPPGASKFHRGTDFIGFSQVRAVASGRVTVVGTPSGWSGGGRAVWIQHDGFLSRSLHLASWSVRVGQWVNEGDVIGVMGMTGTASGVHLHLEIVVNGVQIDPVPFIQARLSRDSSTPARDRYGAGWVRSGQEKLLRLGYELGASGADSLDGPATQGAVRDVQSKNGLVVDGILGPETMAVLDRLLAAGVGRNDTSRPTADIQRLVGANPDGVYGPDTTAKVKAWQRANGLVPDGIWGPASDAKGFPAARFVPIAVDGIWGEATTRALQASLGVEPDGIRGPQTVKALQRAVGLTGRDVDGSYGRTTITYLQAALGVAQDGIDGPTTVKALQSLLNAGGKLTPGEVVEDETPAPEKPAAATYPGALWWHHSINSTLRDSAVDLFIVHHTTETGDPVNVRDYMMRRNSRNVCPTWLVAQDGSVSELVPPDDWRPWTTGAIDDRAVTVETMNTSGAPLWGISDESHEAIAQLVAWASVRYGFPIDRKHVIGHREVPGAATACPGPSMDLDRIVARALELVTPVDPDPIEHVLVPREWLERVHGEIEEVLA